MASEIFIFSLYRRGQKHYLLRTRQPAFSNVSQPEENQALATEEAQRTALLQKILGSPLPADLKFIGELQGFPLARHFTPKGEMGKFPSIINRPNTGTRG